MTTNDFSIERDAKNEAGEWIMSPEQIRAEMAYEPDPFDYYDEQDRYYRDEEPDVWCWICESTEHDADDCTEPDDSEPLGMTDVEADADTLASAGWGTDEDYGYFGDE